MNQTPNLHEPTLADTENSLTTIFLRVLNSILTFKKTFLTILLIPTLLAIIVVLFVLKENFGSTSVFEPPQSSSPASGLSSMLGEGGSALAGMMGISLLSGGESDIIKTILNSKELHQATIDHFHLAEHYEFKGKFPADLLKAFRSNMIVNYNDEKMFELTIEDRDYKLAATMNRFVLNWTDSAYNAIQTQQAKMTAGFYQARLDSVNRRIDSLSKIMVAFQNKYHFYDPEVQLESGIKVLSELDAERSGVQINLQAEEAIHGKGTSKGGQLQERLNLLTNQIQEKNQGTLGIGLPSGMGRFADLSRQYYFLDREIRVQNILYKFIRQKIEEMQLGEAHNIKNLIIVQAPWENNKKVSPPRSAIVLLVFLVFGVIGTWVCSFKMYIRQESQSQDSAVGREWKRLSQLLRKP